MWCWCCFFPKLRSKPRLSDRADERASASMGCFGSLGIRCGISSSTGSDIGMGSWRFVIPTHRCMATANSSTPSTPFLSTSDMSQTRSSAALSRPHWQRSCMASGGGTNTVRGSPLSPSRGYSDITTNTKKGTSKWSVSHNGMHASMSKKTAGEAFCM